MLSNKFLKVYIMQIFSFIQNCKILFYEKFQIIVLSTFIQNCKIYTFIFKIVKFAVLCKNKQQQHLKLKIYISPQTFMASCFHPFEAKASKEKELHLKIKRFN